MIGPCLCGDTECPHCGRPARCVDNAFYYELSRFVDVFLVDFFRGVAVSYSIDDDDNPAAELACEDFAGRIWRLDIVLGEQRMGIGGEPIIGPCIDLGDAGTIELGHAEAFQVLFSQAAAFAPIED